jgi:RHS repeat-associated protein
MGTFPFGESWYNTANDKLLFTTYERDAESGNDYALARFNISGLARFASPDPFHGSVRNPQSLNRYAYTLNNPISIVDPPGQDCNFSGDPGGMDIGASCLQSDPNCYSVACNMSNWGCTMDGFASPCSTVTAAVNMGSAIECAQNNCTGISGSDQFGFFRNTVQDYFATLCSGSGASDDWVCILSPKGRLYLTFENPTDVYFSGDDARIDWTFAQTYNAFKADLKQTALIGASAAASATFNAALEIGGQLLAETSVTSIYSSKVLVRGAEETGPMHHFPMTFDNLIIENGEIGVLKEDYVQYELPGTVNGHQGFYEIGGDWFGDTFVITHRLFRPLP